jgi:hypothetical protein
MQYNGISEFIKTRNRKYLLALDNIDHSEKSLGNKFLTTRQLLNAPLPLDYANASKSLQDKSSPNPKAFYHLKKFPR